MQTLAELVPLLAFFAAWALADFYVATAVLMGAMALLLAWDWLRTRSIPKMHLVSAVLVWAFGAATLILHDIRFIQWKPTVFYWAVALALAGSVWIGKTTLLERLLGGSLPQGAEVPGPRWRAASLVYAAFFAVLGAVNLWIVYRMSEAAWVLFKAWISIPLVFVFSAALMYWLLHGVATEESS